MLVSTTLIILFTLAFYFLWVRPQALMDRYARQFQKRGFSVLKINYNPFRVDLLSTIQKGIKEGDALKYYKQERSKYDVIICNELTKPRIELYHPDFRKDLFSFQKHYEFPKAPRIVNIFSRIAGRGLAFSQGQVWHRKRKILNKVFNFDFIKSQVTKISNIVQESIAEFQQRKGNKVSQGCFKYSIDDLSVKIFSSVMLEIFLGASSKQTIDDKPAGQFIKEIMGDITKEAFKPLSAILGKRYVNLGITKAQREIIRKIQILKKWGIPFINKRLAEVEMSLNKSNKFEPSDLIQALVMVKRSKQDGESISSQEQIFQQFITFFIAGTDTTSNFTTMMLYLLAQHPGILAKVRQQIDLNMKPEEQTFQNLKNFKYIDLVQKQTTRFYGPGTQLFVRYAKSDNYLNNIFIKKGTIVGMMYVATHFNQKYFQKPLQFRPQRWENQGSTNLPNFVFGGFGGGARTCIGKHLALLESKIALIKILKSYKKIELGKPEFKMEFRFLYCPENFESELHRQ